jgi:murein DD-endopeptidase MepM/ murein hydrolase activator NlpD
MHAGVDFAGKKNSEVVAVAAGLVRWSGLKSGFGKIVEIDHGSGLATRYAHNNKNLVKTGDTVKKGQTIALMGSTGRTTGYHVHFEILKDGKAVNPLKFIRGELD